MGEDYVISYPSSEWFINTSLSVIYISSVLIIGSKLSKTNKLLFARSFACFLITFLILYHVGHLYYNTWVINKRLPLHLCAISHVISCVILFSPKKQYLFDVLFYCGVVGGLQAILTPLIDDYIGVKFFYFEYYISHSSIIAFPLYLFYVLKMKLSKFSWLKAFIFLNILMIFIMPLNFLIDSNYMYLSQPPAINHPLVSGNWPYYIIKWEFFVILLLYFTYLIFNSRIFKN